ncbi:MAG: recombination protein RecR [Parachlamydiales bacterium]|nr:recombination protein RecR [Parachlamydiales bacterium]
MKYPQHLLKLFQILKKLPGVGTKSAERHAFQMLTWSPQQLNEFANLVSAIPHELPSCNECGCLTDRDANCFFCNNPARNQSVICILAHAKDVYSIEETREYTGVYHVLGGLLSPLEHKGPEHLKLPNLKERILSKKINEVIIALDSTLEGDATALFLKKELENDPVEVSRLAFGMPMGSSFDYVDGGTLARAMAGRRLF